MTLTPAFILSHVWGVRVRSNGLHIAYVTIIKAGVRVRGMGQ